MSSSQTLSRSTSMDHFRLIHRTNHTGYFILPEAANRHFPLPVIWTQADWPCPETKTQSCAAHQSTRDPLDHRCCQVNELDRAMPNPGCCPRAGRRVIDVSESDFLSSRDCSIPIKKNGAWYLFCVQVFQKQPSQSLLRRRRDIFYKFVLSPTNRMNGVKKDGGIKLRKGRIMEDLSVHLTRMRDKLNDREKERCDESLSARAFFHFHIGLVMEVLRTTLDTPRAIYEYQMACFKAIDECDDEVALDEWIDRGRTHQYMTRTRYKPRKMSETIPEMILMDRYCGSQSMFDRNLKELDLWRINAGAGA
ncbi:hypothetical protein MPSEU_000931600 [Mayamaea pseudoterrestris]|nr:hypothetical protein MPSEU_000931600 [Mayamaea pseudoterrestris]